METKLEHVRFSNPGLAHIRRELERHNITVEQLCRALEPHFTADDVAAFLADEKVVSRPGEYHLFGKAINLSDSICSKIQDILWARAVELKQIENGRSEGMYRAPIHPGIPGREHGISGLTRKEFLEIVGPSFRSAVIRDVESDVAFEEETSSSAEDDSAEDDDDEQENMNENTARTIGEAILEAEEFTRIEIPERRIIVRPWLKEQSIILISGWRGVGKTAFAMGIVEAITRGESFGPWQVREPVPCSYLDGEMAVQDIQERLRNHPRYGSDRKCPLNIYSDAYASHLGMPRAHLANSDWRMRMKPILLAKGIKLWVVDNLASLTAGIDENSKKDWDPINAWLLDLRFAGIATIMLHHPGKSGTQRGTSAREDNVDVSITLKRPSNYKPTHGARFVVKFEKARVPNRDLPLLGDVEFRLVEDEQGRGLWTWKSTKGQTKVEVLKMIHEGSSYDAICKQLGITKGRITQIKQEGEDKGWLDNKGKLTQEGLRFVYGSEED